MTGQCADITFVSSPPAVSSSCTNSSGISAEAADNDHDDNDDHDNHPSSTASTSSPTATPNAASHMTAGGLAIAGVVAALML
jgi:hypothetical protein